jgi:hypothetical protein
MKLCTKVDSGIPVALIDFGLHHSQKDVAVQDLIQAKLALGKGSWRVGGPCHARNEERLAKPMWLLATACLLQKFNRL